MKVHAILLNWRTAEMTLKALESAMDALHTLRAPFRLTIVDNDSQDGSEEQLRQAVAEKQREGVAGYERVDVVQSGRNGGFGAGNNVGIRHALRTAEEKPEYFYILNSDAFPAEDAIERLAHYLDGHAEVGIAGSYIHGVDGEPHVTAFRFPSVFSELEGSMRLGAISRALKDYVVPIGIPEETREVDWLAGASMLVRRSVLDEIGLFDESFFLYFEETDLCRRAARAGWRTVYVLESKVAHVGSASTGMKEWSKVPEYWFDSRAHYFAKNHGGLYATVATGVRAAGSALWQVRRRLQRKPDEDPPGFLGGLLAHAMKRTKENGGLQ